jgi:signal peptidase I
VEDPDPDDRDDDDDDDDEADGAAEAAPGRRPGTRRLVAAVRETALVVAVALVVSLVVKTFLVQAFFIPSPSMEQTLDVGDRVLVSELTPGPFALHRGDVVVFTDPGGWLPPPAPVRRSAVGAVVTDALTFVGLLPEDSGNHLIKRVVGLPGDHVSSDGRGPVTVNGTPVDESAYLAAGVQPSQDQPFDVTVPADRLWVMGDNRSNSADSRAHPDAPYGGFVPLNLVTGRAYAVVWPLAHASWLGTPSDFDSVAGVAGVS